MESDVILADEVKGFRALIDPPVAPGILIPCQFGPLDRGREVTHHGFKPNIKALAFPVLQRHRDAPVEIPGDGCRLKSNGLDRPQGLPEHVRSPVAFARLQKILNLGFQRGEVQEKVLGFP